MKAKRKILCVILSAAMLSALLAGCGSSTPDDTSVQTEETQGAAEGAIHVLEHGEEIGLGSRSYQLVSIDD